MGNKCTKANTISSKIHRTTSKLIITIMVVFLLFVLIWTTSFFYVNSIRTANQNIEIVAESFNIITDNFVDAMVSIVLSEDFLQYIELYYESESINNFEIKNTIGDFLIERFVLVEGTTGADIVFNNGDSVKTSNFFSYQSDDFYENIAKDNEYKPFSWLGPFKMRNNQGDEEITYIIQKRVLHEDTYQELAKLYMYVNKDISEVFYENAQYSNTKFVVVDDAGTTILSANQDKIGEHYENYDIIANREWLSVGLTHLIRENLNSEGLNLIAEIPSISLLSSQLVLIIVVFLLSLVAIAVSLLISKKSAKKVVEPITTLANAMDTITHGERTIRVFDDASDEFKALNKSFNKLMDSNEELLHAIQEKHKSLRKYEFSLFQEQIKPHFLYNVLSNISALIKLDMKGDAIETVENLSAFFRLSLSGINDIITIEKELEIIDSYVKLQQVRFKDKIIVSYEIESKILQCEIPKLTLQPIVENCIYHGTKNGMKKLNITIKGTCVGNNVYVSVVDNGMGIEICKLQEIQKNINSKNVKNFGLTAVNQRLKLTYGSKYKLHIKSEVNTYTEIIVKLPFTNN